MSNWLVDCLVDTELILDPNASSVFDDPLNGLRAYITNAPQIRDSKTDDRMSDDGLSPFLSFRVVVDAATPEEAEETAVGLLNQTLDHIVAFSGIRAELTEISAVLDWTPGIKPRKGWFFAEAPRAGEAQVKADVVLPQIQRMLAAVEVASQARRAMYWIRKGISADGIIDKFFAFWLALEIIANQLKPLGDVADQCPFCKKPLGNCPHCGKDLKHRPYPHQAIRYIICERLGQSEEFLELISDIRHAYVHGESLKELQRQRSFDWVNVTNELGLLMLAAILLCVTLKTGTKLRVLRPSTIMAPALRASAHFGYEPDEKDLQQPDPFKIPKMKVWVRIS